MYFTCGGTVRGPGVKLANMIHDLLDRANLYAPISFRLARGFQFLKEADARALPVGRTEVAEGVFALVQDYSSKSIEDGFFESHRRNIDIQFVANGVERVAVAPTERLVVSQPYDEAKDLIKYAGKEGDWITLRTGEFAVFFPHDAHMPSIRVEEPIAVRKVVVKVAV